jgi:hypothetical protein
MWRHDTGRWTSGHCKTRLALLLYKRPTPVTQLHGVVSQKNGDVTAAKSEKTRLQFWIGTVLSSVCARCLVGVWSIQTNDGRELWISPRPLPRQFIVRWSKGVPVHAMKIHIGRVSIVPYILNLGIGWWRVISLTLRLLYPRYNWIWRKVVAPPLGCEPWTFQPVA